MIARLSDRFRRADPAFPSPTVERPYSTCVRSSRSESHSGRPGRLSGMRHRSEADLYCSRSTALALVLTTQGHRAARTRTSRAASHCPHSQLRPNVHCSAHMHGSAETIDVDGPVRTFGPAIRSERPICTTTDDRMSRLRAAGGPTLRTTIENTAPEGGGSKRADDGPSDQGRRGRRRSVRSPAGTPGGHDAGTLSVAHRVGRRPLQKAPRRPHIPLQAAATRRSVSW